MDEKTRDALEESIRHWERNVAATKPSEASTSARACALCQMFNSYNLHKRSGCEGCPVALKSGLPACWDTPYGMASMALTDWYVTRGTMGAEDAKKRWVEAATAELEFLKGLREG